MNGNMLRDCALALAAIGGGITTILFGKQCYQVGRAWIASKANPQQSQAQAPAQPAPAPVAAQAPAQPAPAPAAVQLDPATISAIVAAFQAAQTPAQAKATKPKEAKAEA